MIAASKRHTRHILGVPVDSKARDLQWALNQVRADDAWRVTTGDGVTVAVVDTGVDAGHPDLAGSMIPGFDAFRKKRAGLTDPNGHGTHVAGTIAAHGMVQGVAPDVKIMPIRAMNARGNGTTYNIVSGIMWAVNHGADIINMSIGSPKPDVSEKHAIKWARHQGVLVVAAAGNDGSARPMFPAAYGDRRSNATTADPVIGVGAVGADGQRASFSQRGNPVDLVAPGVRVLSTFTRSKRAYSWESGTSMATPYVTGIAALALAYQRSSHPGMDKLAAADAVDAALRRSAVDIDSPGLDILTGYGEASASDALRQLGAPGWPGMARDLSVVGGANGEATVTFTPPTGSGSVAVLTKDDGADGARAATTPASGSTIWSGQGGSPVSVTVGGLSPGSSYAVTVFSNSGGKQSRSIIGLRPLEWSVKKPRGKKKRKRAGLAIATTLPGLGSIPAGPITVTYTWAHQHKLERGTPFNTGQVTLSPPRRGKRLQYFATVAGGFCNWPARSTNYAVGRR